MTANGWFQIGLYLFVVFLITKPLGVFMARVFNREKTFLDPALRPVEKLVYRLAGIDEQREMRWTEYTVAMLLFSGVSMTLLYWIERTQRWLPLNPQKFGNTRSASGLDPEISPAAAEFQIARVASERHMSRDDLRALVGKHTLGRQWGVLGEPRVNVLGLNLDLDSLHPLR